MNAAIRYPSVDLRFNISSLMCSTATLAVLVCYLKAFAADEWILGIQLVAFLAIAGALIGQSYNRTYEISLWSTLGAMTALLCAVGEPLAHNAFNIGWAVVGSVTATSAILLERKPLWMRMLLGAGIATLILTSFSVVAWWIGGLHTWLEVACGPLAGAIMVGVVWVLEEIRKWRGYTRAAIIFALTLGVVGGNVFGRSMGWI